MKYVTIIILLLTLIACNQGNNRKQILIKKIDSLEQKLANTYKPGLGEFMSSVQAHHAKLWFAGINQNWQLADFEIHEIMETLENIKNYQSERKESKSIDLLNPAIDSVNNAIRQQSVEQFKTSYTILTNTCNGCHQENDFGFNVVKIPETQPFPNQDFRPKKSR